jgi:c-di-GMP-related signal transduction protein
MNIGNVWELHLMGLRQDQIVRELDLSEEDARAMASQVNSWFVILELEADRYQRFKKRYD